MTTDNLKTFLSFKSIPEDVTSKICRRNLWTLFSSTWRVERNHVEGVWLLLAGWLWVYGVA